MSPPAWVHAVPIAHSICRGEDPSSLETATATVGPPKTAPLCHPRESISPPPSPRPIRGPVSNPTIKASRKASPVIMRPLTVLTCSTAANSAGRRSEALCNGALECQSSSSKPWIKVLLSKAAAGPLSPWGHPKTVQGPMGSISRTVLVARSDQGRWAPMRPHPRPSRAMSFARCWMSRGMSPSFSPTAQLHIFPVCPSGSLTDLSLDMMERWLVRDDGFR